MLDTLPTENKEKVNNNNSNGIKTLHSQIEAWQGFAFTNLKAKLEIDCSQILSYQTESQDSRKQLIEITKCFRKLSDEDKVAKTGGLVRAYQQEIDRITKRCVTAEKVALELFTRLDKVSDPVVLLERLSSMETKCSAMEKENAKLHSTLLQYQENMDVYINEQLSQKQVEWEQSISMPLKAQLEVVQADLDKSKSLSAKLQTRLDEESAKVERLISSRHTETEILSSDLQRAQLRIAELQTLEHSKGSEKDSQVIRAEHEQEIIGLLNQIDEQKQELARVEYDRHQKEIQLQKNDAIVKSKLLQYEARFEQVKDYDKIAAELEKLRKLVLGGDYADSSTVTSNDGKAGLASSTSNATLEQLFRTKNLRLESERNTLQEKCNELNAQNLLLTNETSTLKNQINHQTKLLKKLEEDLSILSENPYPYAGGVSVDTQRAASTNNSSTDEFMSALYDSLTKPGAVTTSAKDNAVSKEPTATSTQQNLVTILARQRDRYRQRVTELEAQIQSQLHEVSLLKSQTEALQKDNVHLYEKIQFLENSGSTRRPSGGTPSVTLDVENRYKPLYEDYIDPFKTFQRHEEIRKIKALNKAELALLSLTKLLFSNHYLRLFFVYYSVGLHLFVMTVMYRASTWECRHDHENLPQFGNADFEDSASQKVVKETSTKFKLKKRSFFFENKANEKGLLYEGAASFVPISKNAT